MPSSKSCPICNELAGRLATPDGTIYNERVRQVHFFILPRTASLPSGHPLPDVYRRGRNLLREWHLLPNPPPALRIPTAVRRREA